MKLILSLCLVCVVFNLSFSDEPIYYISPGLRIGWDIKHAITFGAKVSVGCLGPFRGMWNLTLGIRKPIFNDEPSWYDRLYYLELQAGTITEPMGDRMVQLIYGGGFGAGLTNNGKFFPRMTLFTGMGIFGIANFTYIKRGCIDTDIGLEGVLPIPLNNLNLRFGG